MKLGYWLVGVIGMGLSIFASSASAANKPQDKTDVFSDPELGSMPYHVFVPAGNNKMPVILFLHGAGERGNDNQVTLKYLDGLLQETQRGTHKAIVIVPQVAPEKQWVDISWAVGAFHQADLPPASTSMQMAMKILDKVMATEKVDDRRVYVTGLSMGGYGTWDAITRYPDRFAAAMPLSGGGNVDNVEVLKGKGIWAWHGGEDGTVPVGGSDEMVKAIETTLGVKQNTNGSLIYTRPARTGHMGWGEFYQPRHYRTDGNARANSSKGRDLYDWMFSFRLPSPTTAPAGESKDAPATQPTSSDAAQ